MTEGLNFESDVPVEMERIDAYLDDFPEAHEEALEYIAKLAELPSS